MDEYLLAKLVIDNSPTVLVRVRAEESMPVEFISENVKQYGYNAADFKAGHLTGASVIHPDDRRRVWQEMEEHAAKQINSFPLEFRILDKAMNVRWVDCRTTLVRDEAGRITHFESVLNDITERKAAEEELREQTAFLEAQVESSIDGILVVDANGQRILTNRAFLEMMKVPQEIADDQDDTALLRHVTNRTSHPDEFYDRVVYLYAHPTETSRDEIEFKDGTVLDRFTAPVIGKEDGRYYGRIWSFRDITERKRAEREIARSNADLQQFAYVASHDLQEPLRMVSSYVQLLARRYQDKLDKDAKGFINSAVEGTHRMQRLIDGLLEYSRVQTRAGEPHPTDVERVLDEVVLNLESAIDESGASVTHDPLPTVVMDRVQLTQLLQNLISNAIKFRANESPLVHVSARRVDGEWLFSVRDNGIGIDPRSAEEIFQPFRRLHSRREYAGSGIGLAVCSKIVQRHGGRIWVESEPGKGSTFLFTVPIKDA